MVFGSILRSVFVARMFKVLCLVAVAGISTAALAAGKDKVAVFDVQEAILSTSMAKADMKAFESRADIAKMIKDAEKLKKDIIDLRDEASQDSSKWSAEKADSQKKAVEFKQADFELIVRKLNSERQAAGKKLIDEIAPRLESIVKSIIEAEGIGLLIDKKAAIHVDPSLDITAKVTEKLNAGTK
jgi:outer membrane protein